MTTSYLKQRVFVCRDPTDLRLHFEGLWGLVRSSLGKDPFEGDHFVFIAKSRKRIKVLRWDGTGLCILSKRLLCGAPHNSLYAEFVVMHSAGRASA